MMSYLRLQQQYMHFKRIRLRSTSHHLAHPKSQLPNAVAMPVSGHGLLITLRRATRDHLLLHHTAGPTKRMEEGGSDYMIEGAE